MGLSVGPLVKFKIILGFVDPYAPQNDGRMVKSFHDHVMDVLDAEVFPCIIPDVLPSWDFLEDKKTDFIAAVQEMGGLRIMACPDNIDPDFIFQDIGVLSLGPFRHGIAHIRIGLMAVQPNQLYLISVEAESFRLKRYVPEAKTLRDEGVSQHQFHFIQVRVLRIP